MMNVAGTLTLVAPPAPGVAPAPPGPPRPVLEEPADPTPEELPDAPPDALAPPAPLAELELLWLDPPQPAMSRTIAAVTESLKNLTRSA